MPNTHLEVTVAVDENYKGRMPEVIQNLQSAGMKVERSMEQLGLIVGSIDAKKVEGLSQIEGVLHAEPAREYQLPPPESDIQ